jgi:hypothetical protein
MLNFCYARKSLALIEDTPMSTARFDQQQALRAVRMTFEDREALSRAYRGIDFVNNAARRHKDFPQMAEFDLENALAVAGDVSAGLGAVNKLSGFEPRENGRLQAYGSQPY